MGSANQTQRHTQPLITAWLKDILIVCCMLTSVCRAGDGSKICRAGPRLPPMEETHYATETDMRHTETTIDVSSTTNACEWHIYDMCVIWTQWATTHARMVELSNRFDRHAVEQQYRLKIHPSIREGETFNLFFFCFLYNYLALNQARKIHRQKEERRTDIRGKKKKQCTSLPLPQM